jgi:23S rRNA (guanosine2251-2'-O)-methyltransferase
MAVIYGINPVLEALKSGNVQKIVLAQNRGGESMAKLLMLAEKKSIQVEFRGRSYLDRLAGYAVHQGVVCFSPEFVFVDVEDLAVRRNKADRNRLILILDSVTDPQNLGALIRSAHCFGVDGIIIPRNRAATVTPVVVKASAGAAQHMAVARVVNIVNTIEMLKRHGFWIYGAEAGAGKEISRVKYEEQVGLVMGSEGVGIRPLIKRKCDELVSIPLAGTVGSLNVSVAAGIILFDIFMKRFGSKSVTCQELFE